MYKGWFHWKFLKNIFISPVALCLLRVHLDSNFWNFFRLGTWSPKMFWARSPVSIKDFSRKQWDPFLNYRSWNLGTELIRKPNEPPLESGNGAKRRLNAVAEWPRRSDSRMLLRSPETGEVGSCKLTAEHCWLWFKLWSALWSRTGLKLITKHVEADSQLL